MTIDQVKQAFLKAGGSQEKLVEAFRIASEFNLSHNDPISEKELMNLAQSNRLAFDLYAASRFEQSAG